MGKLDDLLAEAREMEELHQLEKSDSKKPKKEKGKKKDKKQSKKGDRNSTKKENIKKELEEDNSNDIDDLYHKPNSPEPSKEDDDDEKGGAFSNTLSLDDVAGDTKKRPNKLILLANMYFSMLQHWLTKGKYLKRLNLDDESMQIEYDRIFTRNTVKCIWTISSTDEFLPEHFFGMLKENMDNAVVKSRTSVVLTPTGTLYNVDFDSKDVRNQIDHWNMMNRVATRREQNQTEADKLKDTVDYKKRKGIRRMFKSFMKYKQYMAKQFKFAQFYVAIEGLCYDNDEMQLYEESLKGFCADHNVKLKKVTKIRDYLSCMSLTTRRNSKFKKVLDTIILSDLDIAELDDYSQGSVGDNIGVYVGTDIKTSFGVYLNFTATTKAQNILITAITGGGKSFFIKALLLFHALGGHRLAIMDYEGREYIKLVKWLRGRSISMTIDHSVCVNTIAIPDVSGLSAKEALGVYYESYNATENIFRILVNIDGDYKEDDAQLLFEDIMKQLYATAPKGQIVKNDPATYYRSADLNYFKLFEVLEDFKNTDTFKDKHGRLAEIAYNRLEPYWGREGSKRYLFEDEINIQDLYDAPILHFNFGMQGTDESGLPKETVLKMSMMTYVFSKYHTYNLRHNYYTVNLVEEFQRSGNSPMLLRVVNHWITGGRKGNIVNYIVTNAVGVLVNNDNRDAQAIKDNITTFIMGKCRKTSRDQLIEAFDLQDFEETLYDVSKKPEYNNCFLLVFDTGKSRDKVITMMQIAPEYVDDDYFKTRREETYEDWEI